ncbi:hypothetical protein HYW60_01240 [Candidatus Kaiserbacteria bacterium]|nr:hypothetical protein [Candidatus Kaiserbacteria bacterium]
MVIISGRIEEPLLDALFRFSSNPTLREAAQSLLREDIQDAAVFVAEQVRLIAAREDEERRRQKRPLINWREFYVGSVGIGLTPAKRSKRRFDWFAYAAWNTKPHRNVEKYCGEMRIMRAAKDVRCRHIGGLVVVGESQYDGGSGIQRWTLDPCEACRQLMREKYRRLFRQDTLVLTAQPVSQLRILKTIPRLMHDHGESW